MASPSRWACTVSFRGLRGLGLLVLALAVFSGGCEKNEGDIIDSSILVPYISRAEIDPDTVDTDSIDVGPQRLPEDILPITISAESYFVDQIRPSIATLSVLSSDGSETLATGEMSPTGTIDPQWGQKYSTALTFTIQRTLIGKLQVEFSGTGDDGSTSNLVRIPLSIVRLNQPPVLSNLQAPDSVMLESIEQFLLLEVDAIDPDGQADIRSVVFNSTQPNGTPSTGNPFAMYDDGSNGDVLSDDGTYSLLVILPPTTTPGTYRFDFQAVDRSDSLSIPIVHFITVKQ
jgi:hypothetical protein